MLIQVPATLQWGNFFYHQQPCSEARQSQTWKFCACMCSMWKKRRKNNYKKKEHCCSSSDCQIKKRKTLPKQTNIYRIPSASRKRCSRSGRPTPTGAQSAHMGSFAQNAPQSQARTLVITMIAMIMILKLDEVDGGSNLTTQLINISLCRSHSL